MKFFEKVEHKKRSFSQIWIIPFFGFLIGYGVVNYVLHKTDVQTPNVMGKSLQESVQVLSQHQLGVRMLQQREDATLPEGTVVDQLPRPAQKIRPNQNVYVTLSVKKQPEQMPDLWGKKQREVLSLMAKKEHEVHEVQVHGSYPQGMCIAQIPGAHEVIEHKKVTLYFSQGRPGVFIMPNVKGFLLKDVQEAFKQHDIRAEIFHSQSLDPEHVCTACKITDQQPAPGALVNLAGSLQVQLAVAA